MVKQTWDQEKYLTLTLLPVEGLGSVRVDVRLGCFSSSLALGKDGKNQGSGQPPGDIIASSLPTAPRALRITLRVLGLLASPAFSSPIEMFALVLFF